MKIMNRKKRQRGIALVLVLWATTLLTVIAASFVYSMRTDTRLGQNLSAQARAEAAADAGVQRALYEAFRPPVDMQRWRGDGLARQWEFGDARVTVTMLDVTGKIDLNTATDDLLKGLLKSVGLTEEQSVVLTDAIVDWRDEDELPRPRGAEAAQYQAAGLPFRPTNAPFENIEELQRVLGMTPALYASLEGALTVDSRQPGVNAAIAPRQVLLALAGATPEIVDMYLVARQDALIKNLPPPPFMAQATVVAGSEGSVYSIRAEAALPDGTRFVRETIAGVNPGAARKTTFYSWKEGQAAPRPLVYQDGVYQDGVRRDGAGFSY